MKKLFVLFSLLLLSCAAYAQTGAQMARGPGETIRPLGLNLTRESDSGRSAGDKVTNDPTPTFTVGNIAAGAAVELLRDGVTILTATGTGGTMSLTDPKAPLNAASVYKVRQTIGNISSTSAPLEVTFDSTPPSLTIDQAPGQVDPVASLPLRYRVVLSEPVQVLFPFREDTFLEEDIATTGSTVNRTYLFVQPFTCDGSGLICDINALANTPGLVQLSVPAHMFTDFAGNWNVASTSTDNVIDFQPLPTTINFLGRIRRSGDRIATFPLTIRIFDTVTNQTFTVRTNSAGYFRLNNHPFYAGTSRTLTVRVFNKGGEQLLFDAFGVDGDRSLVFTLLDP